MEHPKRIRVIFDPKQSPIDIRLGNADPVKKNILLQASENIF